MDAVILSFLIYVRMRIFNRNYNLKRAQKLSNEEDTIKIGYKNYNLKTVQKLSFLLNKPMQFKMLWTDSDCVKDIIYTDFICEIHLWNRYGIECMYFLYLHNILKMMIKIIGRAKRIIIVAWLKSSTYLIQVQIFFVLQSMIGGCFIGFFGKFSFIVVSRWNWYSGASIRDAVIYKGYREQMHPYSICKIRDRRLYIKSLYLWIFMWKIFKK